MSGSDKQYSRRSIAIQYLRALFVNKSRFFIVFMAQTV